MSLVVCTAEKYRDITMKFSFGSRLNGIKKSRKLETNLGNHYGIILVVCYHYHIGFNQANHYYNINQDTPSIMLVMI